MASVDPIAIVRQRLLQLKQERGLTNEQLAARIKKRNGERYSWRTVEHFIIDDREDITWFEFCNNAIRAFPVIGDDITCPHCNKIY